MRSSFATRSTNIQRENNTRRSVTRTYKASLTCCHFGPTRHKDFPGYFFCDGCDRWDNRDKLNKRINRQQKKYMCTGGHTSHDHPTTHLSTDYYSSSNVYVDEKKSDVDDLNDGGVASMVGCNSKGFATWKEIDDLKKEVDVWKKQCHLKSLKMENLEGNILDLKEELAERYTIICEMR